jgi:hypothetical protein
MATTPPPYPQAYENVPVRVALEQIAAEPTPEALDDLLAASQRGGLVIDVTGSTAETGTRLRTIVSTAGEPVLPLFTSIDQLKSAVQAAAEEAGSVSAVEVRAVILPAREALELIESADFVAAQFNPGSSTAMVVARSHIQEALASS